MNECEYCGRYGNTRATCDGCGAPVSSQAAWSFFSSMVTPALIYNRGMLSKVQLESFGSPDVNIPINISTLQGAKIADFFSFKY